jgi:multiple sugar transport system permease protein
MNRSGAWGQGFRMVAILALLGAAAFPIYWMLVTSMTPSAELFAPAARLMPKPSEVGVYAEAFHGTSVATWVRNSAIVAVGTTLLSLALAVLPAYALSRFRFRGMGLVGFGLFITQMLPEAMLVVPLYAIFGDLTLLNTLSGLILANSAFTVPVITIPKVRSTVFRSTSNSGVSTAALDIFSACPPLVRATLGRPRSSPFSTAGMNTFASSAISDQELHRSVGLAIRGGEHPVHGDGVGTYFPIYSSGSW